MSDPYIEGQKLHKAFWTRAGLRIEAGTVILAGDEQCIVACADTSTESVSQRNPGSWKPTKAEALTHQIDCLGVKLRQQKAEVLRAQARLQSTRTLLAHIKQIEEREEA